mgnify:CR=1 FL=1|jgi:N-acetylmuramoyl-L-alanine amidase CwlA
MNIFWKGSPNKDGSEYRKPITYIILHWLGVGTLETANARFQNPNSQVSAHYGVSDDTVYQWVKEDEVAWHAGDRSVNQCSIGIEHDATTTKNASDKTYQTSGQLVREICDRYKIPIDRKHILKHSEIKPTQCPGTLDVDKIISIAKGVFMGEDIPTGVEDKFGLKDISRYNKYWTYEELIEDWTKLVKELDDMEDDRNKWKKNYNDLEKIYLEYKNKSDELTNKLYSDIQDKDKTIETLRKTIATGKTPLSEYTRMELFNAWLDKLFNRR